MGTAAAHADSPDVPLLPVNSTTEAVQSSAARIVERFVEAVAGVVAIPAAPPSLEVHNTPQLAFFDARANRLVVPHWPSLDPAARAFFLGLTETQREAAGLFVGLFDTFLVAHEMAHWLQWSLELERDLYALETEANDLAVAFFMGFEGGDAWLAGLGEQLAGTAPLPDPAPENAEEAAFFNAHYAALAADPAEYGYYQFRFILDSIARRANLVFELLVRELVVG
jgi:hypothetical protein